MQRDVGSDAKYLVLRATLGDLGAFEELFTSYHGMVFGLAYAVTGGHHAAEDVLQETFLHAYVHLGELRDAAAFPAWLRRVVLSCCSRRARRRQLPSVSLAGVEVAEENDDGPEERVQRAEAGRRVLEAVDALPEGQRAVTMLHYLDGVRQADIAGFLELPLTTIKKRLHDARRALRATLSEEDYMDKRALIREQFRDFVSPRVLKKLLEDPAVVELRGESRELTAMFIDLEGFTAIFDLLDPSSLVALLNGFFEAMCDVIRKHDGVLCNFLGDAILALWGAPVSDPAHAANSARAALEMQRVLGDMRERSSMAGQPALRARIGVNTGEAIVGNYGYRGRMYYRPLGHAINLAARVEGQNRDFGTSILVTEFTARYLGEEFTLRSVGEIELKTRKETVELFELLPG